MNNRRRQQIRALNMMIRSKSNGKIDYNGLVKFAHDLMEAVSEALYQASASLVSLGESIQPFIRASELIEQLKTDISAEDENDGADLSCDSCYNYLGGGCCRINLESECREGGGFEAWAAQSTPEPVSQAIFVPVPEPDFEPKSEDKPDPAETILKWASIGICVMAYPLVIYKLYEWIKYLFF